MISNFKYGAPSGNRLAKGDGVGVGEYIGSYASGNKTTLHYADRKQDGALLYSWTPSLQSMCRRILRRIGISFILSSCEQHRFD